jgi:hypothetical protein
MALGAASVRIMKQSSRYDPPGETRKQFGGPSQYELIQEKLVRQS